MKIHLPILTALLLFWGTGCGPSQPEYKHKLDVATGPAPELRFDRYEDVLFNLDTANFQQTLISIQDDYLPFLRGDLSDSLAVNYLKEFAIDPFEVSLYHKVKSAYPDLESVKEIVSTVYRHFNYYYPQIQLPTHVYTCVSGISPDTPPVICTDEALIISLDWYLNRDEVYDWIGMPKYRSERTEPARLAKDLGQELYVNYVQQNHKQVNLVEEMVNLGKMDYFTEALYPAITDQVLLGYPKEQLDWAVAYEGELWADLVGNGRLYVSDLETYRIFLSDGPFTNEYSHDAPPRLGEFLGLHIVRAYMGKNDVSLQQLLENNDLQGIFLDSGYKPKK